VGGVYYPDSIVIDDAFITFRYAENLAAGRGFVFNPGENFLGTSAPLFGLVLGVGQWLTGLSVLQWAVILHLASMLVLALVAWSLFRDLPIRPLGLLFPYLLLLNPLVQLTQGMESVFFLGLAFLTLLACVRGRQVGFGAGAALLCLARPDGAILAGILLVSRWWRDRRLPRLALGIGLGIGLPWLVYATVVYGSPIPASVGAKVHQAGDPLWPGWFLGHLVDVEVQRPWNLWWILAVPALVAAFFGRHRSARLVALWCLVHNGILALFRVPGYFWYYVPLLAQAAFLVLHLGARIPTPRWMRRSRRISHRVSGLAILAVPILLLALKPPTVERLSTRFRTESLAPGRIDYFHIGNWLRENTPPLSTVAAVEVGILGYYADRTIIDFLGLVTPGVSDKVPERAHVEYVFRRYRPDYVVGNVPQAGHDANMLQYLDACYFPAKILGRRILFQRNRLDEGELARRAALALSGEEQTVYFGDFPKMLDFEAFTREATRTAPGRRFTLGTLPEADHVLQVLPDGRLRSAPALRHARVRFGPEALMTWHRNRMEPPQWTPEGVRFSALEPAAHLVTSVGLRGPFRRIRLRIRVEDLNGFEGGDARVHLTIQEKDNRVHTVSLAFSLRSSPTFEDILVRIPFGGITGAQALKTLQLGPLNRPGTFQVQEVHLERQ